MTRTTSAALIALALAQNAFAQEETVSNTRDQLAITIYNESLAMVRENRTIPLKEGTNRIALRDVSARIMPETAILAATGENAVQLLEQNFDYDLLNEQALLDKYVGKKVIAIRTNGATGEETREEATVLSNNNGVILQYADRIESGLPSGVRLAFADVPANLRDRPTLLIDLLAAKAGEHSVNLSYLTQGLSWKADYVATLGADEKTLALAGWVTLQNQSGTAYENATLQLVAGNVNRVREYMNDGVMFRAQSAAAPMMEAAPMQQEELFEYHLYTLSRPTTIANNQRKQVALLSAADVPVQKEYRLQGADHWYWSGFEGESPELGDKRKVDIYMQFDNKENAKLGMPLPKGTVRVYKSDSEGRSQFIGEDAIDHTAKNDTVRLKLGSAFDVNGTWKQLSAKQTDGKISRTTTYEGSYEIELSNAKKEDIIVKVVEPIPGNWSITQESHQHEKADAHLAQWHIPVPADSKVKLTYSIKTTY